MLMEIQVTGMHCEACVRAIEDALDELAGVRDREVEVGKVRVDYDAPQISRPALLEAIRQAGDFGIAGFRAAS